MPTRTMCPHCSRRFSVDEKHVGKSVTCKGCGEKFVITKLDEPESEVTPGGVRVYRPTGSPEAGRPAFVPTPFLDRITSHIERTIGPSPSVFHELVSTDVHIDLHTVPLQPHVSASKDRPLGGDYVTIVTSGMSSRPMKVPEKSKQNGVTEYAELMLALPKDWPGLNPDGKFDQKDMKDETKWWPFRWLKQMARLPHQYNTFYAHGVTVPNGEPPKPFVKGSELCCWMLFKPLLSLSSRQLLINDDVRIDFFALFALTDREMNLKLNKGLPALTRALADRGVYTELLDVGRRSVV